MKILMWLGCVSLLFAQCVFAANEKIDPKTYICAEILAANTTGEPPLFEGLQIDGYVARQNGEVVADPEIMESMLIEISDVCQAAPTDVVIDHWKKLRENHSVSADSPWRADKTTCGDYYANEDDGSGFLIWTDGWQRAKTGQDDSIFATQEILDKFLAACRNAPEKLVIDVITETLKK